MQKSAGNVRVWCKSVGLHKVHHKSLHLENIRWANEGAKSVELTDCIIAQICKKLK
jgi:hypothetical protein